MMLRKPFGAFSHIPILTTCVISSSPQAKKILQHGVKVKEVINNI
jgi:hypothetical protein